MSTLDDIKARMDAATEGPWELRGGDEWIHPFGIEVGPMDEGEIPAADADFIAHARTDVPKLVAALEAVEKLAEEWRLAFREDASDTNDIWDDAARKIEQAIAEALA